MTNHIDMATWDMIKNVTSDVTMDATWNAIENVTSFTTGCETRKVTWGVAMIATSNAIIWRLDL